MDIKRLQGKILEITLYLDRFCKENSIEYYLMGGSALGALRHHGFIPWDDDLDVFMTYDNYMKFIDCAKKNLDQEHYYLQEENTQEWPMFFTKLRMNGTTFIEENTQHNNMHQGVYVDIMCLNNVSSNVVYRYLQYIAALFLTAQTLDARGYRYNHSKLKVAVMLFARYFVRGKIKSALLSFVRSLNTQSTVLVGHFFGKASFKNTSFPRKWLGNMRYVPFEDVMLPVPQYAEDYLTMRFGDWRKMPDEKTKAQYPIHALLVDLENDYTKYVGN